MWALGHQQSRYSYYPDKLVENVVDRYRADDLPLDAVHLDLDYMNGHRIFTWDPRRFPDPRALTARLAAQGVKVVTIVDPGIKYQPPEPGALDGSPRPQLADQDRNYYVYSQGAAGDYFLKRANGSPYSRNRLAGQGGVRRLHDRRCRAMVGRVVSRVSGRGRRGHLDRYERAIRLRRPDRRIAEGRGDVGWRRSHAAGRQPQYVRAAHGAGDV